MQKNEFDYNKNFNLDYDNLKSTHKDIQEILDKRKDNIFINNKYRDLSLLIAICLNNYTVNISSINKNNISFIMEIDGKVDVYELDIYKLVYYHLDMILQMIGLRKFMNFDLDITKIIERAFLLFFQNDIKDFLNKELDRMGYQIRKNWSSILN